MVNYTRKAVRGVSIVFVMSMLSSFFSYLLRLLLARSLTLEEYGLIYAIIALFGPIATLKHMGLRIALIKYIAEFRVNKEFNKIKSSIISTTTILFPLSILLGCIFIFLSDYLAVNYFHNPQASVLIKIYSIAFVFVILQGIIGSAFMGFQRMKYFSYIDASRMLVVLVLSYVFLEYGFQMEAPMYAYAIGYSIPTIFFFYLFVKRVFPEFKKIKAGFDKKITRKLVGFGLPVMLASFGGLAFGQVDTILLTLFRPMEEVGLYNVGFPTSKILWTVNIALVSVLIPMSSELWAQGKREQISRGFFMLYKYAFMFIFPVSVLIAVFPEIVINILFGKGYAAASQVLQILSVASIILSFAKINNSILNGIGRPREVRNIMLYGLGFNVIANLVLIPYFGMLGAAVATSLSFLVLFVFSLETLKRYVEVKIPWREFMSVILGTGFMSLIVQLIREFDYINLYPKILVAILLGIIVYLTTLHIFNTLTKEEILDLVNRIK